jgi:N6-adenosine-specific RNA methylase IME4
MVDPPWPYATYSPQGQGRSASRHYRTLSVQEIMALPIVGLLAKDAIVALWSTAPHAALAHEVLRAWGLAYRSQAVWLKTNKDGSRWVGTG